MKGQPKNLPFQKESNVVVIASLTAYGMLVWILHSWISDDKKVPRTLAICMRAIRIA